MSMVKFITIVVFCACIIGQTSTITRAGEKCNVVITNGLEKEVINMQFTFSVTNDEPRVTSMENFLEPGQTMRLGIQGVHRLIKTVIDLPTESYVFADIFSLNLEPDMFLSIQHEGGQPILARNDGKAHIKGDTLPYWNIANSLNAIDMEQLWQASTAAEIRALAAATVKTVTFGHGFLKAYDIKAGPLWSHEHALKRCPEVVAQWSKTHAAHARWTGHWVTTVPNEMSVCEAFTGAAPIEETLFTGVAKEGPVLAFPLRWKDWTGAGRVYLDDNDEPEGKIFVSISLPVREETRTDMVKVLSKDMESKGYLAAHVLYIDGDEEKKLSFLKPEEGQPGYHETLQKILDSTPPTHMQTVWLQREAFQRLAAGNEPGVAPAAKVTVTAQSFVALFYADASWLAE